MVTLYSYPGLFGVADNNPFGLKAYAFLRLSGLAFAQEHIFDASSAPRGQLPYIVDGEDVVGDSDAIIDHLTRKHGVKMDALLSDRERAFGHCIKRTLEDLYWVMSYSRWRDPRYWPSFRQQMLTEHPVVAESAMEGAREYNFVRYQHQGIGRYQPEQVYERGIADLRAIATALGPQRFLFGDAPSSVDASVYGFVANILYFRIGTPLRSALESHPHLVRHCNELHALM
jgi:glutathione S-transferase